MGFYKPTITTMDSVTLCSWFKKEIAVRFLEISVEEIQTFAVKAVNKKYSQKLLRRPSDNIDKY